jgi:hypothetical protein
LKKKRNRNILEIEIISSQRRNSLKGLEKSLKVLRTIDKVTQEENGSVQRPSYSSNNNNNNSEAQTQASWNCEAGGGPCTEADQTDQVPEFMHSV